MEDGMASNYVPGSTIPPGTVHIGMGKFTKIERPKWGVVFEDGSRRCTKCLKRKPPGDFHKGKSSCKGCYARTVTRRSLNG